MLERLNQLRECILIHARDSWLKLKAQPPTHGLNRDRGTASVNGSGDLPQLRHISNQSALLRLNKKYKPDAASITTNTKTNQCGEASLGLAGTWPPIFAR